MRDESGAADEVPTPAAPETGARPPRVEIEFDVVSVLQPRVIRLHQGDGDGPPRAYHIPQDDEAGADSESSLLTIILWAYYEACRRGEAWSEETLPWKRTQPRAWRSFQDAMRSHPDFDAWWSDPARRLEVARQAYGTPRWR